jgi:F420-dependent oxidoreductase, G6PDH family
MRVGLVLSTEEYTPEQLVEQARLAANAGMVGLCITDHFHPWISAQGQASFVWTVIGAVSQASDLPIMTAVTCPTVRIHPAIIAQAAATCAVMTRGRFRLGVGTGEALNESILGGPWPNADVRREMLAEAIEVMRQLWTGKVVNHRGPHYTVQHARLYTVPDEPVPVYVSAFGPASTRFAAEVGDGFVTTRPDKTTIDMFRQLAPGRTVTVNSKACVAPTLDEAEKIAYETWPTNGLPGELNQVLPAPAHVEQAASLVRPEQVTATIACGPDPERHIEAMQRYRDAGADEIYVAPVGPHYREMIAMYTRDVLPALAATTGNAA